jgi:hypothetical protein
MFVSHVLPLAVVLSSVVLPPSAVSGRIDPADGLREQKAVSRFLRAVDGYILSHRLIEPPDPDAMCVPDESLAAVRSFAGVPLDERPTLQEGAIFLPDVADVFRQRMTRTLLHYEHTPPELATAMNTEELLAPSIKAGEPLPWGVGRRTFAWLFATLPALPEELEYRLVARDLVLFDVRARVVVDVLRDALPVY